MQEGGPLGGKQQRCAANHLCSELGHAIHGAIDLAHCLSLVQGALRKGGGPGGWAGGRADGHLVASLVTIAIGG